MQSITTRVEQPHKFIKKHLDSSWMKVLYIPTERSTIDQYLTFKVGEKLDLEKVKESIRKLRAAHFIWDANYQIVQNDNCSVTVNIVVNDTFPTKIRVSLSRRNGTNKSAFGLVNTNIFGTGTSLQVDFINKKLRDQKLIKYSNPNFSDRHYHFTGIYSDNSDGKETFVQFARPFNHLDSNSSFNIILANFEGDLQLYNGTVVDFITSYTTESPFLSYGVATGESLGFTRSRSSVFLKQDRASYQQLSSQDRNLISLGGRFNLFDTDFVEIKNIRNMSKTEDYNQGLNVNFNVAAVHDQISNRWAPSFAIDLEKNFLLDEQTVLITDAKYQSRFFSGHLGQSKYSAKLELNHFSDDYQSSWNGKVNFLKLNKPTLENYIQIDEEFAVRGYPFGYRIGDTLITANLEKRWFNIKRYVDVVDVAGVIFFDAGVISVKQSDLFNRQSTTLRSAGIGLRISPTKLSHNIVVHVDLAFPHGDDIDQGYQLNIFSLTHF